jgi:hypothetical protein
MDKHLKNEIDRKYNPHIARIFSAPVIHDLIDKRRSRFMKRIMNETGLIDKIDPSMRLTDFYQLIYQHLLKTYRNEYVYKNAIAEKILLGRHSLNTSFMLMEFRVGKCKADTVVLNGTSNVYEIKSEFDSLERLRNQIRAYQKVFDRINVVTSPSQLAKVETVIHADIGLSVLTPRKTIRIVRGPVSNKARVEPTAIFDSLRKTEYLTIIRKQFGFVPDVPNTVLYKECQSLFRQLSPTIAHDSMVSVLKQRGNRICSKKLVTDVPGSLKAVSLMTKLTENQSERFREMLKNSLESCLGN